MDPDAFKEFVQIPQFEEAAREKLSENQWQYTVGKYERGITHAEAQDAFKRYNQCMTNLISI